MEDINKELTPEEEYGWDRHEGYLNYMYRRLDEETAMKAFESKEAMEAEMKRIKAAQINEEYNKRAQANWDSKVVTKPQCPPDSELGTYNIDTSTPARGYNNPHAVDEKMNKTEILEHMKEKLADRGKDYGDVTENHARQIDMINPYLTKVLGVPVNLTPSQMATIMLLVKVGRLIENKDHLDSWADLIGYSACGYEMVSKGDGKEVGSANDDDFIGSEEDHGRLHWK